MKDLMEGLACILAMLLMHPIGWVVLAGLACFLVK
jgi:hypothetical protein